MKALITGSGGLIGSQATKYFIDEGFDVVGIDNNMRAYFFGEDASTKWNVDKLKDDFKDKYTHFDIDIRDFKKLEEIFKKYLFYHNFVFFF